MTDTFTASNGYSIGPHDHEPDLGFAIFTPSGENSLRNSYSHLNDAEMDALREFFQHERDKELGRWRWPENPDFVVYRADDGQAVAVDEKTGHGVWRSRGEGAEIREALKRDLSPISLAAEAYFDAHPEPKPWHDAKEGEVWLLSYGDGSPEYPSIFQAGMFRDHAGSWDAASVVSARRIWPEGD